MAKYNIYAVAHGIDPKTKEPVSNLKFKTWDECKPYVVGINGAKYKGFLTDDEADAWLLKYRNADVEVKAIKTESISVQSVQKDDSLELSVTMSKEFRNFCSKHTINAKELTEYLMNSFIKQQEFLNVAPIELPWD